MKACLGDLLQLQIDFDGNTREGYPLARYAAEHSTTHAHAQFGKVSSLLQNGIEHLFDLDKPHFKGVAHAVHYRHLSPKLFNLLPVTGTQIPRDSSILSYYAAVCGFHDLVDHLTARNPQDVNADGGYYRRPLAAALAGEHFQTGELLRPNGADPDVRGKDGRNPFHSAAFSEDFEVVWIIIEYDPANVDADD